MKSIENMFLNTRENVTVQMKSTISHLFEKIVERTPVVTGTAKGNWNLNLNEPVYSFDPEKKDVTGETAITSFQSVLYDFTLGQCVYLCNSTPYIALLEAGYSPQAEGGIIASVVMELISDLSGGLS